MRKVILFTSIVSARDPMCPVGYLYLAEKRSQGLHTDKQTNKTQLAKAQCNR